jgi:hypothetical protein
LGGRRRRPGKTVRTFRPWSRGDLMICWVAVFD